MSIKSAQTLVAEALTEIKTLSPAEALEMVNSDKCNLIDIRDIRELEKMGRIEILITFLEECWSFGWIQIVLTLKKAR